MLFSFVEHSTKLQRLSQNDHIVSIFSQANKFREIPVDNDINRHCELICIRCLWKTTESFAIHIIWYVGYAVMFRLDAIRFRLTWNCAKSGGEKTLSMWTEQKQSRIATAAETTTATIVVFLVRESNSSGITDKINTQKYQHRKNDVCMFQKKAWHIYRQTQTYTHTQSNPIPIS